MFSRENLTQYVISVPKTPLVTLIHIVDNYGDKYLVLMGLLYDLPITYG